MASEAVPVAVAARPRRLSAGAVDAMIAGAIFVVALVVYLANGDTSRIGDTVPNSLLGFNLVEHGSLTFNAFRDSYLHGPSSPFPVQSWFTNARNGDVVSAYPIGAGLVALPLQVLEAIGLRLSYHSAGLNLDITSPAFDHTRLYFEKLDASIITATAIAVAYLVLRTRFDRRVATVAALLLAFGTSLFTTASQGMWQHGPLLLVVLIAARLMLGTAAGRRQVLAWAVAGALFGFAFGIRPTGIAYGVAMALFLPRLGGSRAARAAYLASLVVVAGTWALWAHSVYGSLTAGYTKPTALYRLTLHQAIEGLGGLTVSPARGILIYTPLVALALFVVLGPRRRSFLAEPVAAALLLAAAVIAVSYCFDDTWYGGWSYGPRMLSDTLGALVLPLGFMLEWSFATRWRIGVLVVLATWSVFTEFVGAFGQPGSNWNAVPTQMANRLWDWSDNPIRRQLNGTLRRFQMTPVTGPTYLTNLHGEVVSVERQHCGHGSAVQLPAGQRLTAQVRNAGRSRWFGYLDSPSRGEVRLQLILSAAGKQVQQFLYVAEPPVFGEVATATADASSAIKPGAYDLEARLYAAGLGPVAASSVTCTAVVR